MYRLRPQPGAESDGKECAPARRPLEDLCDNLPRPSVWLMVPAGARRKHGQRTGTTAANGRPLIDGEFPFTKTDARRSAQLKDAGLNYIMLAPRRSGGGDRTGLLSEIGGDNWP